MLTPEDDIEQAIAAARAADKLVPARAGVPWAGEIRAFLMCKPLCEALAAGRASEREADRKRWAQLETDISTFVEGGLVTTKFMKQLQPPKYEHWELISRRPKPSLRVFGRFAKPDVFVGTHVKFRNGMGGMGSPQFEHEKLVCEDHWKAAGLLAPFSDAPNFRYETYITENAVATLRGPK